MKVVDYQQFVTRTDQFKHRSSEDRLAISLYGLAGEIGSLLSAIKKKLLSESGEAQWDQPSEEIKEELGDALWYCFALAKLEKAGKIDVLRNDIRLLSVEIDGGDERANRISAVLDPASRAQFLQAAARFPSSPDYSFDEYQLLAFKTARTAGRTLLEVCLAVLTQLAAELLRQTLPQIERDLNRNVADRPTSTLLSEAAWHLAAIASLHHLTLNEVVHHNRKKVGFRSDRGLPTPLHDEGRPASEQFPRRFDISFVRISPGRSRMYFEGRRLGDDLSDNARDDDGYRLHDVMHLALVAHLGWSPVVRGMMRRKRPDVDEFEDGGRAKVVEELVLKAIHSEGERQSEAEGRCQLGGPARLFPVRTNIPFSLLKTIRYWVEDLEVSKNTYWEWEDAIYSGCEIFDQLRRNNQGTVTVDLERREVSYSALAHPGISGIAVGLGMGSVEINGPCNDQELLAAPESAAGAKMLATKRAVMKALSLPSAAAEFIEVSLLPEDKVSVKATGSAQQRIWELGAVDFKVAFVTRSDGSVLCSALAVADPVPNVK